MRVWLALLTCLVPLVLHTRVATAEPAPAEVQIARRLFEQATRDEEAGRWEAALEKLRNVEQIKVTPGVLFHIAVCEQNLGHYVEALNELVRSEELARERNDDSVLALVPERRSALESKVAQLRVVLQGDSTDTEVLVDGRRLSQAALGLDVSVNPGEHRIIVQRARGHELVRKVMLQSGERRTEEITVPFTVEPSIALHKAHGPAPVERRAVVRSSLAKQVVIYSSYAVAIVGIGAGVFWLADAKDYDKAARGDRTAVTRAVESLDSRGKTLSRQPCTTPYQATELQQPCVALGRDVERRADSEKFAVVSFAIAGVGALAGTAAIIFWPDTEQEKVALRIRPTLGGLLAQGSF